MAQELCSSDCLFIHVPHVSSHDSYSCSFFVNIIAMGIFSMSNEIKKNGYNPQIFNLGVEKIKNPDFDIAEYIKEHNIKLVGMSLHWHYQTYDTLLVAKHIKEINPDTHIFLGGIMSSAFAEDILKDCSYIDMVIKGEGEKPVVELVKKIKNNDYDLSNIPNLYWKDKNQNIHKNGEIWFANEEELNSYSFDGLEFLKNYETYLKFPMLYKNNFKESKKLDLDDAKEIVCCLGRGCPGNCTWCGGGFNAIKEITGRNRITLRNPEIVANEFIEMKKKYDINLFYICYDPFPNNQEYLIKLFEIFGKEMPKKIRISFECFGLPTKEFVDAFAKNLERKSAIIISPEFGNEQMRFRHKAFSFTDNQLISCINYIVSKKVYLELFFSALPFEDEKSINATRKMINAIMPRCKKDNITIHYQPIVDVEPYSPWALEPEKYKITPKLVELRDYIKNSKSHRDFV